MCENLLNHKNMPQSMLKYIEQEREIIVAATSKLEIRFEFSNGPDAEMRNRTYDVNNHNLQIILKMRKEYALTYTSETNPEKKQILLDSFLMANKNILQIIGMSVPQEKSE